MKVSVVSRNMGFNNKILTSDLKLNIDAFTIRMPDSVYEMVLFRAEDAVSSKHLC